MSVTWLVSVIAFINDWLMLAVIFVSDLAGVSSLCQWFYLSVT